MANPEQKMAIAKDPKELARKLVKTDPENYVTGVEGKAGLKKFSSKHSVLRTDAPNDTEENNDAVFSGSKQDKEQTTRRADMDNDESQAAYESTAFNVLNPTGKEDDENAQKVHAVTAGEKGPEAGFMKAKPKHEKKENKGTETTEPIGKIKTPLPPQVAWASEEVEKVYESTDNMSDAAHELVLHADNDRHLYRNSHVPVAKNLEKKFKKGTYKHDLAGKLWSYHADRAAQSYAKQHGDVKTPWHKMFTTADRKQAAAHMANRHKAEMEAGNFHEGKEWDNIPALVENFITELGEPMSPAPATSDNPGGADQNNMAASPGKDADSSDEKNDENEDENSTDSAAQIKDDLEAIAMMAAEMYENISDDMEIPDWALEKIDLAKNFVTSVHDSVEEMSGEDDEETDEEPEPKGKPTDFKGGQAAMAKEGFAESVLAKLRIRYGD